MLGSPPACGAAPTQTRLVPAWQREPGTLRAHTTMRACGGAARLQAREHGGLPDRQRRAHAAQLAAQRVGLLRRSAEAGARVARATLRVLPAARPARFTPIVAALLLGQWQGRQGLCQTPQISSAVPECVCRAAPVAAPCFWSGLTSIVLTPLTELSVLPVRPARTDSTSAGRGRRSPSRERGSAPARGARRPRGRPPPRAARRRPRS
jgi:hypothetical protein